jgi:hypothetical protein
MLIEFDQNTLANMTAALEFVCKRIPACALRLIATTRYDGLCPPATIDRDHPLRLIATRLWTGVKEAVG